MIIADLNALYVPLDGFVISGEVTSHVYGAVDDLISAAIAQHAYHDALKDRAGVTEPAAGSDTTPFIFATRTPHVFAQAWVRSLRDIAGALIALADEGATVEPARAAAAAFGKAFPGVATAEGPMRVDSAFEDQVYFADGPARYPVRIDDAAVRDLEHVVRGLVDALPKERPFEATG